MSNRKTMKLKLTILFVLLTSIIIFLNYYANPPDGYTGAPIPNELSCTVCHFYDTKHIEGSTEILGIPVKLTPGDTYPVEIVIKNPDKKAKRTSFQFLAFNGEKSSGILSNPGLNVKFSNYKDRIYSESQPGRKINNKNTVFKFDWTAPSGPDNSVISFFATSVLADGDNTFANDAVKETAIYSVLGNCLHVDIIDLKNNSCRGDSSGYAEIEFSDGTPPYSILWSNGKTSKKITGLKSDLYFVTVTDATGLKGIGKIKITEPRLLLIDSTRLINPSENIKGSINIFLSGGNKPYHFTWKYNSSFFSNQQNIYNLNPGKYYLEIIDSCGTDIDTFFNIEYQSAIYKTYINEGIIVYPIPAKSYINIISKKHKVIKYSIFDLSNETIEKKEINTKNYIISVASLKKGIYFLELHLQKRKIIKKIIII